jgi:long-chain acyl-CoA synthetase
MSGLDTLPKNLIACRQMYVDEKIAMRQKDMGIWRSFNWEYSCQQVRDLCLGLMALGLKRGDKVCIIGDNDPQYFWAQLAIQSAGGAAVGIFTDSSPAEIQFVANHSDSVFVFAKDQEQCDKLLEIQEQLPFVQRVIYWEEKGLWNYAEPWLMSYEQVRALGRKLDAEQPELFELSVEQGKGDDLAIFCYTSGTTGIPKGVMISHSNLIAGCDQTIMVDPRLDTDEYLSFLPPAWITENVLGLTVHLRKGMIVNFPEAPETVQENIREVTPQAMLFSARLWESMMAIVQVKISDTSWINRTLHKLFMPVGYRVASLRYEQREPIGLQWRLLNALGELALFHPLRDKFGLTKVKSAYSSGAALNPDMIHFFRAIDVNIKQLYGSTEAQTHTLHINDDVKFETVSVPADRKSGSPRMVRSSSPSDRLGATIRTEATRKAIPGGCPGQALVPCRRCRHLDKDGHLIYLGRVEDDRYQRESTPHNGRSAEVLSLHS